MPTIGTVLRNRYKIINILGSGGFGDTYLAVDIDLPNEPKCVVKHLKHNPNPAVLQTVRRLFDSEAQVLYRLGNESEQIPRLFAHFEEEGEFYLVQEFVDGEDLSKEIIPGRKLTEQEVTKLLQEILEVLVVVHQQKIIHRDIKPQNIMRRRQDSKIVLIDFGAVKEVNALTLNTQGATTASIAIGTPGYMPSEQAAGQPKLCSDIYAVGTLGIQALTGLQPSELPKDPLTGEIIWHNWANVSEGLALVLNKMVTYHFRDRFFSAEEALQALQSLQQLPPPLPISTQTQKPEELPTPKLRRRRVIQTVSFGSIGLGLGVLAPRLWQPNTGKIRKSSSTTIVPTESTSNASPITPDSLKTFQFQSVMVDAMGKIVTKRNLEAKYFVEDLGNGVTLEMVQIPQGTFLMGSPTTEAGRESDEGPQHQVIISSFFMGKYEVTQAQFQAVMGKNPSTFKGGKRPVERVSWDSAAEFCQKLSQKMGRIYRLPSEAEWEYACRAGTSTPFYFGETITTDLANFDGSYTYGSASKGKYRQQTTEVGTFPPNAFGLYDMHGNVWEWCEDEWHANYDNAPTDGSAWLNNRYNMPWSDNNNNQELMVRMLRGGSWIYDPNYCRSASRYISHWSEKDYFNSNIGFRVVCDVKMSS